MDAQWGADFGVEMSANPVKQGGSCGAMRLGDAPRKDTTLGHCLSRFRSKEPQPPGPKPVLPGGAVYSEQKLGQGV